MAQLPPPSQLTVEAIYRWRQEQAKDGHRPHLGASLIGHPCDRYLWLTFHWAATERFPGRILRMFDSGKREEPRVYEELRGIGAEVWADDGSAQFTCSAVGGHFGGSLDGVVEGIPESKKTPHVLEIKTHNAKSFADLCKRGVKGSKPQHYAQMQTYMHLMELERALYFAVCKDDDQIYTERVEHDPAEGERIVTRARRIIEAAEPPPKIAAKAEDAAECGWCKFKDVCHGSQAAEVNCRTCCHSTADTSANSARWTCGLGGEVSTITVHQQRKGCEHHLYIPPLLANVGEPVDGGNDHVVYRRADGSEFINGPAPGYSSTEIAAGAGAPHMLTDPAVQQLKQQFSTARLVGAQALAAMPNDDLDAPAEKKTRRRAAA